MNHDILMNKKLVLQKNAALRLPDVGDKDVVLALILCPKCNPFEFINNVTVEGIDWRHVFSSLTL